MPVVDKRSARAALRGITAATIAEQEQHYRREVLTLSSSTTRYYDSIKKFWKQFLLFSSFTETDAAATWQDGAILPSVTLIKNFLKWYIGGSEGVLGDVMSLNTSENSWHRLHASLKRWTGNEYSKPVEDDILATIRGSLSKELNIQDNMKEKGYADEVDADILVTQLFCHDYEDFFHDRTVIEMAFLLHLHIGLGNRPGSILPTQDYKNVFLRYRHIQITLDMRSNGMRRFGLLVEQDNMKGRKLRHDPLLIRMSEQPIFHRCAVTLILALAFADEAFESISTPAELFAFQLQSQEDVIRFSWKKDIMDAPVLRCRERYSVGKFWYRFWWENLKKLSLRAGYCQYTKPYHIRRAVANRLHENVSTSSANQVIGHGIGTAATFQKHYQDKLSGVDVQGLMYNSKQDDDFHIERFRRLPRGLPPPPSLSAERKLAILHHPLLQGLDKNDRQYRNVHTKLTNDNWTEFLNDFHRKNLQPKVPSSVGTDTDSAIPLSIERFGDLRNRQTRARVLRRYVTSREIIDEACKNISYTIRDNPGVLKALIGMCKLDKKNQAIYYPDESPRLNGTSGLLCHICGKHIESLDLKNKAIHMHNCHSKSHTINPQSRPEYCFRCNKWYGTINEFREHCEQHLKEIDMFCGILRCRGLVASAGRCPFCLSDPQLTLWKDWHKMMQQFDNTAKFSLHLKGHLESLQGLQKISCPHPLCTQNNAIDLKDLQALQVHFNDDHGIDEAVRIDFSEVNSSRKILELPSEELNRPTESESNKRQRSSTEGIEFSELSSQELNQRTESESNKRQCTQRSSTDRIESVFSEPAQPTGPVILSKRVLRMAEVKRKRRLGRGGF